LVAGVAHAEDAPSEQAKADARRADARARYEQGVEAYSNGRFKDAVDLFLAADRLSPSAPLSFNIARAYEKLGDDSGALRWYRDYVRRSPNAANLSDVNALIATYESRLAKKGVQQLTILSTPSGATILVDQSPVGVTPWTGDLAPGRHVLELRLRGYSDSSSEVDLNAEHAQDVSIRLEPTPVAAPQAPTAQPVAPASPAPPRDRGKGDGGGFGIVPYIVMGAGGLVLGGALTFELLRQGAEKDAEKETTQVGYKEKYDTMASRRTTARILTGVGGGLVLVGGALLAVDLMGSKSESAATLTLAPRPGGAEAGLRGSF
jgi:tetratricopeptide (TPR) repeat protein